MRVWRSVKLDWDFSSAVWFWETVMSTMEPEVMEGGGGWRGILSVEMGG